MTIIHSFSDINAASFALWVLVGFGVGLGWGLAGWLVSKMTK
jgi:hypothetical protein